MIYQPARQTIKLQKTSLPYLGRSAYRLLVADVDGTLIKDGLPVSAELLAP